MDFGAILDISASGLAVQKTRMATISNNMANATTTRTAEGGPYQRRMVVVEARPVQGAFAGVLGGKMAGGVGVARVVTDGSRPLLKYEPAHPQADANGYVAYPNVNTIEEIADMTVATRAYEANITAAQATKAMALKTLELGK